MVRMAEGMPRVTVRVVSATVGVLWVVYRVVLSLVVVMWPGGGGVAVGGG